MKRGDNETRIQNHEPDVSVVIVSDYGHPLGFISMQTEPLHSTSGTTDLTRWPPLSIVVATTKPWPEICACLDSLLKQTNAVGAEILVGDGHSRGLGQVFASLPLLSLLVWCHAAREFAGYIVSPAEVRNDWPDQE